MWTRDNLDVLRGLNSESIDLVYADPPFNSNGTQHRQPAGGPPRSVTRRSAPGHRVRAAVAGLSRLRQRVPVNGISVWCRLLVSSICLALVVPAVAELAQTPWSRHAPFRGLHAIDRVTTSNDEYSISLYWSPERFRIDYPDSRGRFERDPAEPGELYTALSVFCRADGRQEALSGPRPLGAKLSLPMHPAAPAVYSVLHPMYWLLGLTGREFERVPVVVDLAEVAPFDAELVRRRIAYGRPRPDLEINLPGAAVLSRFVAGSPMRLAIAGDGVDIKLWFAGAADLIGPAKRMAAHCAPAPG